MRISNLDFRISFCLVSSPPKFFVPRSQCVRQGHSRHLRLTGACRVCWAARAGGQTVRDTYVQVDMRELAAEALCNGLSRHPQGRGKFADAGGIHFMSRLLKSSSKTVRRPLHSVYRQSLPPRSLTV